MYAFRNGSGSGSGNSNAVQLTTEQLIKIRVASFRLENKSNDLLP